MFNRKIRRKEGKEKGRRKEMSGPEYDIKCVGNNKNKLGFITIKQLSHIH